MAQGTKEKLSRVYNNLTDRPKRTTANSSKNSIHMELS